MRYVQISFILNNKTLCPFEFILKIIRENVCVAWKIPFFISIAPLNKILFVEIFNENHINGIN